jgi:FtsP/CotA-like multicopper oxidase with cupredoxin domain
MISVKGYLRIAFFLVGLASGFNSEAITVSDTVYINRGEMMAVDSSYIPYLAFNSTSEFKKLNKRLHVSIGDSLRLTIINTDSVDHGFDIKYYSGLSTVIQPLDSATVTFTFPAIGAHIYYDPTNSEGYRYMGLAGMIVVEDPNSSSTSFYWNIKDHQKSFNETIGQGLAVDWSEYYPDYFTINGNSNPHINDDSDARVVGNVGDTILIYMVNTGQSLHSLHYHGYHSEIKYSSKFPTHVGRLKDTFAIPSMETVLVELIPHQLGEFPVHDHNLVAVSGGNIYPNGMFLTMLIN